MKWRHYLTSVCFAFLGLFVGSFIINQNSASAVSDIVITIDSSNYNSLSSSICTSSCSSYHYFYWSVSDGSVAFSNASSVLVYIRFVVEASYSTRSFNFSFNPRIQKDGYFELSYPLSSADNLSTNNFSIFYNDNPNAVITLTLTENNPFGSAPSGSLFITANGEYDVSSYATAVVEVPDTETIIQGDYHDDLVSINNSIMVCAGVCLVLYFFYCIYRMFIKTGGK